MITKDEALRLFTGYTNYSMPVMREFIDLIFGLVPPLGGYLPIAGGTMQGNVLFPQGNQIHFTDPTGATLYSFFAQNGSTTFLNAIEPGSNIQVFGHTIGTFRGGEETYIGTSGKKIGFFGSGVSASRQPISNIAFVAPTNLPTCIAEIIKLQTVVNNIRTGSGLYNLFQLV